MLLLSRPVRGRERPMASDIQHDAGPYIANLVPQEPVCRDRRRSVDRTGAGSAGELRNSPGGGLPMHHQPRFDSPLVGSWAAETAIGAVMERSVATDRFWYSERSQPR